MFGGRETEDVGCVYMFLVVGGVGFCVGNGQRKGEKSESNYGEVLLAFPHSIFGFCLVM